jgi:hypothetical protein
VAFERLIEDENKGHEQCEPETLPAERHRADKRGFRECCQ